MSALLKSDWMEDHFYVECEGAPPEGSAEAWGKVIAAMRARKTCLAGDWVGVCFRGTSNDAWLVSPRNMEGFAGAVVIKDDAIGAWCDNAQFVLGFAPLAAPGQSGFVHGATPGQGEPSRPGPAEEPAGALGAAPAGEGLHNRASMEVALAELRGSIDTLHAHAQRAEERVVAALAARDMARRDLDAAVAERERAEVDHDARLLEAINTEQVNDDLRQKVSEIERERGEWREKAEWLYKKLRKVGRKKLKRGLFPVGSEVQS